MTATLVIPWLREGYERGMAMCHPMESIQVLEDLANFLEFDLMPALTTDQLLLIGCVAHAAYHTPIIKIQDSKHEAVMVTDPDGNWLVSVRITNGKPPGHSRLHRLIKDATPSPEDGMSHNPLPVEWQFPTFDDDKTTFTIWLQSSFWLFAFFDQLRYELSQY